MYLFNNECLEKHCGQVKIVSYIESGYGNRVNPVQEVG